VKRRNRPKSSARSPNPRPESVAAARVFEPKDWLFIVALLAAVVLVYEPAWQGGFIWDDDLHLLNNPVLKPGGLLKTWVPGSYVNYWPVTATVYWLQFKIWGPDPVGFHIANIVLHAISALLVWRILVHLKMPGAMFAAALFAIHPVNVESVAWIAQLKTILSLLLALLSMLLYLRYEERGKRWRFALAIGLFLLSALAKGMTLTLPVVLLACAWWQRGRIGRRDLLRVLPFVLIGLLMVGVEVWQQRLAAGGGVVRSDSFLSRAAVAGCAVWFYLWKLIWPVDLIFVYPRWNIDARNVLSYLPGVLLVIILALAWRQRRSWGRPVVMLMVCYVALLLPALGFVNIYFMEYSLVADHWQYAAMIVPCAMFAAVAATLGRRWHWHRPAGYGAALVVLAMLATLTWRQSRMYADVDTLYQTTIDRNPNCWMAHNNLGVIVAGRGQTDEAIAHYQKALNINPDYVEAHNNLGNILAGQGRVAEAIAHYRKSLAINPDYPNAHNNLGLALARGGQVDEAITHYRQALETNSDFVEAHYNLGLALAARGQIDEAVTQFEQALDIKADYAEAHNDLGIALAKRGQIDEAIAHYRKALEINPYYRDAHNNLGIVLASQGHHDAAVVEYGKALEIDPNNAAVQYNLATALTALGRLDEAIVCLRKALAIDPQIADFHYSLAQALAKQNKLDEAKVHFQAVLKIKPNYVDARKNLDMAEAQRQEMVKGLAGRRELLRSRPNDVALLNELAWTLATNPNASIRNGAEAVELAQRATQLSDGREPAALGTLAAAYAEAGRFSEAVQTARKAAELATRRNNSSLAESINAKISLYEAKTPFREMSRLSADGSTQP
jgi:tetratricopeptide (TPR) repeat protein